MATMALSARDFIFCWLQLQKMHFYKYLRQKKYKSLDEALKIQNSTNI